MKKQVNNFDLPSSREAENALLGSILLDNACLHISLEFLTKDDFYFQSNRMIFAAMTDLMEAGSTIDLITVGDRLRSKGELEAAGGDAYVASLTDGVPIGAHSAVKEYVEIIREKSARRKLINTAQNTVARCRDGSEPIEEVVASTYSSLLEIGNGDTKTFVSAERLIDESIKSGYIDKIISGEAGGAGMPTDLADLDEMTGGIHPGELTIVAARPSLGKTALAMGLARAASKGHGKVNIGFFSLEMPRESLLQRVLCSEGSIDSHKIRAGLLSKNEIGSIVTVFNDVRQWPLHIDDTSHMSVVKLISKAKNLKAQYGPEAQWLWIVDYLQLVSGGNQFENRNNEVSFISRMLKSFAKDEMDMMVVLSQLSRDPEKGQRKRRRPRLSDLRDSGAIEQDADLVIFIHSEQEYVEAGDDFQVELIVGKQRNGRTGIVKANFLKRYARFENWNGIPGEGGNDYQYDYQNPYSD